MSSPGIGGMTIDERAEKCKRDTRAISPATTAEEFGDYLMDWGNSVDRPEMLLALHHSLFGRRSGAVAGSAFWRWVVWSWSGFDAIPHAAYWNMFGRHRKHWTADCMGAQADRVVFNALPDTGIRIWRGQDAGAIPGLSWTTDLKVAESFSLGHRGERIKNPTVLERVVNKSDIAFVLTGRQESEIVLFDLPLVRRNP